MYLASFGWTNFIYFLSFWELSFAAPVTVWFLPDEHKTETATRMYTVGTRSISLVLSPPVPHPCSEKLNWPHFFFLKKHLPMALAQNKAQQPLFTKWWITIPLQTQKNTEVVRSAPLFCYFSSARSKGERIRKEIRLEEGEVMENHGWFTAEQNMQWTTDWS